MAAVLKSLLVCYSNDLHRFIVLIINLPDIKIQSLLTTSSRQ